MTTCIYFFIPLWHDGFFFANGAVLESHGQELKTLKECVTIILADTIDHIKLHAEQIISKHAGIMNGNSEYK